MESSQQRHCWGLTLKKINWMAEQKVGEQDRQGTAGSVRKG